MRKLLLALAMLAASFLALTSCTETDVPAEIKIPDAESQNLFNNGISFSPSQATASLSFVTTTDWSISVEETKSVDWLSVTPSKGSAGTAKVTVKAQDNKEKTPRSAKLTITSGNVTKSLNVTQAGAEPITPSITIVLDITEAEMLVGETLMLIPTITPDNERNATIVWSSSNTQVATVAGDQISDVVGIPMPVGKVTAVGVGEAIITAKVGDASATCKIIVADGGDVEVTDITLDKEEIHMSPGQTFQLTATVTPEEATGTPITWSSSSTTVASVDQTGKVTAHTLGETIITASVGDKSASCLVKVESEVAIEGIILNEESLTLNEGDTFQLIATLLPETATPKPIVWISSIPDVATVDENGLVTAVRKGGPTMVWAIVNKDTYQEMAVKCEVTVIGEGPDVEGIEVTPSPVTVGIGETTILTATLKPEGAVAVIQWFSDNTDFATVEKISDTQAKVTGVGVGTTKVVASVGSVFDYSEVTVEKKSAGGDVESLSLNKTELQLGFYQTEQLKATILPEGSTAEVTWSSSNEDVVLVSNGNTPGGNGIIYPAGTVIAKNLEGEATVTARAGDKEASCHVTVQNNTVAVTGITLNKEQLSLTMGYTEQLIATVLPDNATDKTVTWSSTNDRIASVTNGLVVAQGEGQAVITASAGGFSASCTVTVTSGGGGGSSVESAAIDPSSVTLELNEEQVLTLVTTPADPEVTIWWESQNQYIANVQMISKMQAKVKGVSVGETTVIVHAGDKTATCAVKVQDSTGSSIPVESVTLNEHELNMTVNTQFQLIATVLPANASNKEVVWSSNVQSSKLYIDVNGMVTALQACEATITVRCKANAYIYDTCHVVVTGGSSGTDEMVDLGLSVNWRAWNVGASKPEDYGNYFAWGETSSKSSYSWNNYKFGHSQNGEFSKYDTGLGTDNKTVLEAEDDAATANLGGNWRMPTYKEWKELVENCTWTWTTRNGVNGMQVKGPNNNTIFLPAAGVYNGNTLSNKGTYGSYWTASLAGIQGMASTVDFISTDVEKTAAYARCYGLAVRPVMDKTEE